ADAGTLELVGEFVDVVKRLAIDSDDHVARLSGCVGWEQARMVRGRTGCDTGNDDSFDTGPDGNFRLGRDDSNPRRGNAAVTDQQRYDAFCSLHGDSEAECRSDLGDRIGDGVDADNAA